MSGIESGGGVGIWIAYAAIVAFVLLLLVILARTAAMYSLLLLLPVGRLLRWIPGMPRLLNRLERKRQTEPDA